MATTRISVIIIAYNAEPYIAETLESVFAQDYPNLEVIVVDDGSTDGTERCVRQFGSRVRYIHQDNSGGCSKPRNTGTLVASGEFLVFLDSDDLLAPGRLAAEAAWLQAHPKAGMVFSDFQPFDASGRSEIGHFSTCPLLSERLAATGGATPLLLTPMESTELFLTENFGSSSPMVRRAAVRAVGGYDVTLRASEDFDFQYRVASRYAIGVLPRTGWYKRLHPSSMSSNTPNIMRFRILTRSRLLEQEPSPGRRRKLKRRIAEYHASLGYYYTGRDNISAFRHVVNSARLGRTISLRLLGRLALDVLGRNTPMEGTR